MKNHYHDANYMGSPFVLTTILHQWSIIMILAWISNFGHRNCSSPLFDWFFGQMRFGCAFAMFNSWLQSVGVWMDTTSCNPLFIIFILSIDVLPSVYLFRLFSCFWIFDCILYLMFCFTGLKLVFSRFYIIWYDDFGLLAILLTIFFLWFCWLPRASFYI